MSMVEECRPEEVVGRLMELAQKLEVVESFTQSSPSESLLLSAPLLSKVVFCE